MTKYDPNQVVTVRISEVEANKAFNVRREAQDIAQETGETASTGYVNLVYSIAKEGQKQPCVVRPHPKAGETRGGKKYPVYELVSGFQRFQAICDLAAGGTNPNRPDQADELNKMGLLTSELTRLKSDKPTIRVFVRELGEEEAAWENLTENTQRANLSAPDLGFGMARLFRINKNLTLNAVSNRLGISPSYAGVIKDTYDGFAAVTVPAGHELNTSKDKAKDVTLAEVWRQESVKIKKDDAKAVATLKMKGEKGEPALDAPPAAKLAAYEQARKPKAGGGSDGRGKSWVENACEKHAVTVGTLLGNLERDGAIKVISINGDHVAALIGGLQKVPTLDAHEKVQAANPKKNLPDYDMCLAQIATAIKKHYKEGLKAAPVKSEDATTTAGKTDGIPSPPESKTARKGKAAGKNGKAAHA